MARSFCTGFRISSRRGTGAAWARGDVWKLLAALAAGQLRGHKAAGAGPPTPSLTPCLGKVHLSISTPVSWLWPFEKYLDFLLLRVLQKRKLPGCKVSKWRWLTVLSPQLAFTTQCLRACGQPRGFHCLQLAREFTPERKRFLVADCSPHRKLILLSLGYLEHKTQDVSTCGNTSSQTGNEMLKECVLNILRWTPVLLPIPLSSSFRQDKPKGYTQLVHYTVLIFNTWIKNFILKVFSFHCRESIWLENHLGEREIA